MKCSPYSHKHIHTTYKWIYVECASRWLSLVSLCARPSVRRHHRRCIKWRELHVVVTFRICAKAMCRWPQIHTSIHIYARRTYNNNATYICLLQRKQRKKASTLRTHTRINNSSNRNGKRSKGGVQQSKVVYFAKKHNYTNKHASKPIIHHPAVSKQASRHYRISTQMLAIMNSNINNHNRSKSEKGTEQNKNKMLNKYILCI